MSEKDWAQSLKAGDQIAMRRGYGYATYSVLTVDRVTGSQVIASNYRFRKDTLRQVGTAGSWESVMMTPLTPQISEQVEKNNLRAWLNSLTRTDVPLEALRAMKAAHASATPEEKR